MVNKQMKEIFIVSAVLAVAGIILMFLSISFATSIADSWLFNQPEGVADTNQYMMRVETYRNNFVILGSMLIGTGILTAILSYFSFVIWKKHQN